jgi:hypothetical protein
MIMNAPKDSVLGPIYYQGGYSLFKVTGIKEDSLTSVHAIKCEVPVKGGTKQDTLNAIVEAKRIAAEVKSSNNAMALLNQKSTIGEVINPYDMGWFNETSQPTDINKIIKGMGNGDAIGAKTIFGVSVIKLVAPKSRKLVQIAEVRRGIEPLQSTQDNIYNKALEYRDSHIHTVNNWDEFMDAIENKTGFVSAHWDGTGETEEKIKDLSKATIRCVPLNNVQEDGVCVLTGKPSTQRVLFAKAY